MLAEPVNPYRRAISSGRPSRLNMKVSGFAPDRGLIQRMSRIQVLSRSRFTHTGRGRTCLPSDSASTTPLASHSLHAYSLHRFATVSSILFVIRWIHVNELKPIMSEHIIEHPRTPDTVICPCVRIVVVCPRSLTSCSVAGATLLTLIRLVRRDSSHRFRSYYSSHRFRSYWGR